MMMALLSTKSHGGDVGEVSDFRYFCHLKLFVSAFSEDERRKMYKFSTKWPPQARTFLFHCSSFSFFFFSSSHSSFLSHTKINFFCYNFPLYCAIWYFLCFVENLLHVKIIVVNTFDYVITGLTHFFTSERIRVWRFGWFYCCSGKILQCQNFQ